MLRLELQELIKKVLVDLGISDIEPQIERPTDISNGDYSTNVALIEFKNYQLSGSKDQIFKSPLELAFGLVKSIGDKAKMIGIDRIEVVNPGFINFWISKEELSSKLDRLPTDDDLIADIGKNRKVIVEYSSPNIAKPFTIGHLRSTIIGDAVANILKSCGYTVYRDSHVGDWGTQFGKLIYAIKTWGDEGEIGKSENPVKSLVDLYIKFHKEAEADVKLEEVGRSWFKKLEEGDPEARRLWEKCIEWSFQEFRTIYQKLGVKFTENEGRGYGESFFEDKMAEVVSELREKGLLTEGEEGAMIVEFSPDSKLPPLMILKKDGATLYSTRDLATDKFRLQRYGKDITIINEVGAEQALYFRQLYFLEEILGWYHPLQRIHIKHGLYRFKDEKMSTRRGNVIWLEEVLSEAVKRAKNLQKGEDPEIDTHKLAEIVGIGALKWNDLKRDSKQNIVFDWDDILNMEGNSGPYLQYTYARIQSVLRKAEQKSYKLQVTSYKLTDEELQLLRLLYFFPESVTDAAQKYSPNIIANYLYNLAQAFNLFYQKHPILKADKESQSFRLRLTEVVGMTIKKGLNLLGIEAPERM